MRLPPHVLLGFLLVACAAKREPEAPAAEPTQTEAPGAMPMEAPSPTAAPETEAEDYDGKDELHADLSTLEKAEAELARARSVLDGLYVAEGRGVEQAPKRSAAPSAAAPPAGGVRTEEAEEKAKDDRSRCDTACRAFASLERAADAVCRLAGDAKDRCARAKKLVDENGGRVASCSCRR